MEKTISYLNSKVLYRIFKAIFVLVLLLSIFGYNFFIFTEVGTKNIDFNKTIVVCAKRGSILESSQTLFLKDIGLILDRNIFINEKFDYKFFYTNNYDFEIKSIIEHCRGDNKDFLSKLIQGKSDIYEIQKAYEVQAKYDFWRNNEGNFVDSNNKEINEDDNRVESAVSDLKEYKEQVDGIYGSDKSKFLDFNANIFDIIPVFTYGKFIKFLIIGNLSILLFFEIVRRVFYYIVLGTIKPKK